MKLPKTNMKLFIDIIDDAYNGNYTQIKYQPTIWDISDSKNLLNLVLAFGNGILIELRAEGESEDVIGIIRGIAIGTGGCEQITLSKEEKEKLQFYQEGDECWGQFVRGKEKPFAHIMIDPIPHPGKSSSDTNPK